MTKAESLYEGVEKMLQDGVPTAKAAFAKYAEEHGITPGSVQAMYYQQKKKLSPKPSEPESLASQLRVLASKAQDLEDRVKAYEAIRESMTR